MKALRVHPGVVGCETAGASLVEELGGGALPEDVYGAACFDGERVGCWTFGGAFAGHLAIAYGALSTDWEENEGAGDSRVI